MTLPQGYDTLSGGERSASDSAARFCTTRR